MIQNINIDKIKVDKENRIRLVTGKKITKLKESIKRIGLIHPIIISNDYRLIAGFRRLSAMKRLRHKTIPAIIKKDLTKLEELDIEIEENWRRQNLTSYEMDLALARRKELYDELHPESTRKGSYKKQLRDSNGRFNMGNSDYDIMTNSEKKEKIRKSNNKNENGNSSSAERFSKVTAQILNISERTVQRRVRVGKAIREHKIDSNIIEKYQNGKISHTIVLKKVQDSDYNEKKYKKEGNYNRNSKALRKKEYISPEKLCKNCKKVKASTCPCCGDMVLICDKGYLVLKDKNSIACKEYEL